MKMSPKEHEEVAVRLESSELWKERERGSVFNDKWFTSSSSSSACGPLRWLHMCALDAERYALFQLLCRTAIWADLGSLSLSLSLYLSFLYFLLAAVRPLLGVWCGGRQTRAVKLGGTYVWHGGNSRWFLLSSLLCSPQEQLPAVDGCRLNCYTYRAVSESLLG